MERGLLKEPLPLQRIVEEAFLWKLGSLEEKDTSEETLSCTKNP